MTFPSPSSIAANAVAIYGGGFDPTTNAHKAVADQVHAATGMPIWMMPCYAHRFGKELASPVHRLNMVKLIADTCDYVLPFDFEIKNRHNGSMFETLEGLDRVYPHKTFYVIMGMDNANQIERWDRGLELITKYPCVVCGRKGYSPTSTWYKNQPHIFVDMDIKLCASEVRDAIEIQDNIFAKYSVSPKVWDYIVNHSLYGYRESEDAEA